MTAAPQQIALGVADDEPHRERPARPGEFCDFCPRRAFVVYLTEAGPVAWCGRPETTKETS